MTAITYKQLALGWHPDSDRDHVFNLIALVTLGCFLGTGLLMSSILIPKTERPSRAVVPDRIARFILERPKPKPEIKPQPQTPPPKPEQRIQRTAPVERKPLNKAEAQARKSAQSSGLLALAKELNSMADSTRINAQVAKKINTAPTNTAAATVDTNILTSDSGKKSIGLRPGAHVANVGTTALAESQNQLTQGLLAKSNEKTTHTPAASSGGGGGNVRGDEDVAMVMDQHKGILHSIYNRARRTNPSLKGKIVLVLTILPSGQVSRVVIKSSELNAPELEASIVARVKQFDFGKRSGGPLTVTVPVEFLPS